MLLFFNTHIPPEVVQQIVRQLDPISLIALSQTSKSWRAFISPIQHDYVQRLLALELMPEHGGIVPMFDELSQKLCPPWDGSEWKSNKYACCGCMKLQSHMMFDNHAILRRPYRKPPPWSVEAEKAAITDWEPLEPSARWRRIQAREARVREEQRKWARIVEWRRDYVIGNRTGYQFPLAARDHPDEDEEYPVRAYLTGTARQKRRCIECKRLLNIRTRPPCTIEVTVSPTATAVISRQGLFLSMWDRHFPGLVEPPPPEERPRVWRSFRGSRPALGLFLNVYVVFCRFCKKWLMDSAFRNWKLQEWEWPLPARFTIDPLICNRCYLESGGGSARLARELSAGALAMFQEHRREIGGQLRFGWDYIYNDFNNAANVVTSLAEFKAIGNEILDGLEWVTEVNGYGDRRRFPDLEKSDLLDLRRRFERYREFIYDDKVDSGRREEILKSWFKLWVEDYDKFEGMYIWLGKQIAWLESEPNAVLDYVLERDPYQI
ncbi:hypothetical protein N657DRAFT_582486 [Parathielavia appendiculata]|uniref:F-box domain-containing protein n=1 Tax=Parathielavia appendiculata TaxID=2587402 RepID=A0AAN6TS69_9PEZI|nr:hypothetical protein N657DRAFT_582486 [Parathielavia appendiculata]